MVSERDPHLLAALRHAPDRDVAPPPEVSARILAAAREVVRPVPAAPAWRRLGAWLVQPQVGAAFATVAVATLLGVMWGTQAPPPTAPPPQAAPQADAPSPMASPAPAPAPASATLQSPPAAEGQAAKPARRQAAAPERLAKAAEATAPPATPAAPAASPAAVPPAAAPPAAPDEARPAAATTPAAPPTRARSERAANPEPGAFARSQGPAPAALADAAPAFDPLQALEARGTGSWTWHTGGPADERRHDEPQRAWWAAVRLATQGRWQAVTPPQGAPWLVLQHGAGRTRFWLADEALLVVDDQGRSWRAPVSAEQAGHWQRTVSSW